MILNYILYTCIITVIFYVPIALILCSQSKGNGYKEGYDSGKKQGDSEGFNRGYDAGHQDGFMMGVKQVEAQNKKKEAYKKSSLLAKDIPLEEAFTVTQIPYGTVTLKRAVYINNADLLNYPKEKLIAELNQELTRDLTPWIEIYQTDGRVGYNETEFIGTLRVLERRN